MKLSKTILGALLGVLAMTATANAQIGFIVRGGYNGANLKGGAVETKMRSGFRIGAAGDITVYNGGMSRISIQPGIDFSTKGAKMTEKDPLEKASVDVNFNLNYIDIPVLANFSFDLGNNLGVFVNAGPYLGFGIGGNTKVSGEAEGISGNFNVKEDPFGDKGFLKRFDWGAQVGAGVEYGKIQLGLGTQFGFGDLAKSDAKVSGDKAVTTSDFFVTLGYRF